MRIFFVFMMTLLCACSCITYKSDSGLISSASANVDVVPITVNSVTCKSNNGTYGGCFIYLARATDTKILIPIMPYEYEISIDCTNALNFEIDETIKDYTKPREYIIPKENYSGINESFYCKGEIYPSGTRPASVSFRIMVILTSDSYVDLANPTVDGKYIVLGQYAYKSVCCNSKKCKFLTKTTYIENQDYNYCYVESESGRGAAYVR